MGVVVVLAFVVVISLNVCMSCFISSGPWGTAVSAFYTTSQAVYSIVSPSTAAVAAYLAV